MNVKCYVLWSCKKCGWKSERPSELTAEELMARGLGNPLPCSRSGVLRARSKEWADGA